MKNIFQIALALGMAAVIVSRADATPITGSIGFSGTATVDTGDADTATKVVGWGATSVSSESGAFINCGGSPATLTGMLNFYGTKAFPLLQFDGFTFSLWGSAVFDQGSGFVKVFVQGNMRGNGFTATPYSGWLQISDPPGQGAPLTSSLSLSQSAPDVAATGLLLGGTLASLLVIRRKWAA